MFNFSFNKKKLIEKTKHEIIAKFKKEEEEKNIENKKFKVFELEEMLGKLVISVSNEIENPIVGYGKEIIFITKAQMPILVIHDIVKNVDIVPLGVLFAYTEQKFDALNQLDANARIAIIYSRQEEYIVEKSKTQTEELIDSDIWKNKVKKAIEIFNTNKACTTSK
jgi:hypothetical protein